MTICRFGVKHLYTLGRGAVRVFLRRALEDVHASVCPAARAHTQCLSRRHLDAVADAVGPAVRPDDNLVVTVVHQTGRVYVRQCNRSFGSAGPAQSAFCLGSPNLLAHVRICYPSCAFSRFFCSLCVFFFVPMQVLQRVPPGRSMALEMYHRCLSSLLTPQSAHLVDLPF